MNDCVYYSLVFTGYLQIAESKLKALSVAVRLRKPDKRFETIKNYGIELQVIIRHIIFIILCFILIKFTAIFENLFAHNNILIVMRVFPSNN